MTSRPPSERSRQLPLPQTKAQWVLDQYYPDDPVFPLDPGFVARIPKHLTGRVPRNWGELYGISKRKPRPKREPKTQQRTTGAAKEEAVPLSPRGVPPRPGHRARRHAPGASPRGVPDPRQPAAAAVVGTQDRAVDPDVPLVDHTCASYRPGHQTHWIAAIRLYVSTPHDPITILASDDQGWVTFLDGAGCQFRWWHHDPSRFAALRRLGLPFCRVRGTQFLVAELPSGSYLWVYCADAPTPCVAPHDISDPITALKIAGGFTLDLSHGRTLPDALPGKDD